MKVYLHIKGADVIEINLSIEDLTLINRKDLINVNAKSYIVKDKAIYFAKYFTKDKTIYFDKDNKLDYVVLFVEEIK